LLKIIKDIVQNYGENVLDNPKRMSAFLADLAQDVPKPKKNAFIKSLELGFVKILKEVNEATRTVCKQGLTKKLHEEEGFDIKICSETLDLLSMILFNKKYDLNTVEKKEPEQQRIITIPKQNNVINIPITKLEPPKPTPQPSKKSSGLIVGVILIVIVLIIIIGIGSGNNNPQQPTSQTTTPRQPTIIITPEISINRHPVTTTNLVAGNISGSLSVDAYVTQNARISYQWYRNTAENNIGGTLINGATNSNLLIPTNLPIGTHYFYCVVSATAGATARRSRVASVVVRAR